MVAAEEQRGEKSTFANQFHFIDNVHGQIQLNIIERDAVDSPEFQRLFHIAQLGLVDITYQTGNHTRGAHSIGTCHAAQKLLAALKQNHSQRPDDETPDVTLSEQILIRLGALLHDIPHGPFSHDIEKKKHLIKPFGLPGIKIKSEHGPFEKHDDYPENAAFYIAVFDTTQSVLARVLAFYSGPFWEQLQTETAEHLQAFLTNAAKWVDAEGDEVVGQKILPQLLFHLFAFENMDEALAGHTISLATAFGATPTSWHLGPASHHDLAQQLHNTWYQPFRHEVIGNTLSADLIDYLARDCALLHISGGIDESLLRHYVLTRTPTTPPRFRCAIDLFDHKRGIIRTDRLNDIFQMLEIRHEIHEKAVYHRMAQSALAMLSRAVKLGQAYERRQIESEQQHEPLTSASLYGFGSETGVAVRGDEHFMGRLVNHPNKTTKQLASKLAERRLFRPLMIIPGHRVRLLIPGAFHEDEAHLDANEGLLDRNFRELAALMDAPVFAPFFSVISTAIEVILRHELTDVAIHRSDTPAEDASLERFLLQFTKADLARRLPANHRVIFWTLPFKQLFKDPAIVVTAKGRLVSLDELNNYTNTQLDTDDMQEFRLIHERVRCGIRDADVRYAQMWKLYVFVSDGLFYGGSMAKLVNDADDYAAGCAEGGQHHLDHLRTARDLAGRAIRVAWDIWSDRKGTFKDVTPGIDDKTSAARTFLLGFPDDDLMGELINRILVTKAGEEASEVNLKQYQHGEGATHSNCRDIRYRFERPVDIAEESPLGQLLHVLKCSRPFYSGEITELTETLHPDAELLRELAKATRANAARLLRQRALAFRIAAIPAAPRQAEGTLATENTADIERQSARAHLESSRTAISDGAYSRAKQDARAAQDLLQGLPEDSEERRAAEDGYWLADTAQQYDNLARSARQHFDRAEHEPALNDLAFLDNANTNPVLHVLLARAYALRADIRNTQRDYEVVEQDLNTAERFGSDDQEALQTVERVRGQLFWHIGVAELRAARAEYRINEAPSEVAIAMMRAPKVAQHKFLDMIAAELKTKDAFERKPFAAKEWRALYDRFKKQTPPT